MRSMRRLPFSAGVNFKGFALLLELMIIKAAIKTSNETEKPSINPVEKVEPIT